MKNINYLLILRIKLTIIILLFYLALSKIKLYGINTHKLILLLKTEDLTIVPSIQIYFGGLISKMSFLGLNLMPYLLASLVIGILTLFNQYFKYLKENSQQILLNKYTYLITFIFAIIQSSFFLIKFIIFLESINYLSLIEINILDFIIYNVVLLTLGTFIILLIIKLINTYGLQSNGLLIILIVNISYYHINSIIELKKTYVFIDQLIIISCFILLIYLIISLQNFFLKIIINTPYLEFFKLSTHNVYRNILNNFESTIIMPYDLLGISFILISNLSFIFIDINYLATLPYFFIKFLILNFSYFFIFKLSFNYFNYKDQSTLLNITIPLTQGNFQNYFKNLIYNRIFKLCILNSFILILPEIILNFSKVNYLLSNFTILSVYILVRLIKTFFQNLRN